MDGEIINSSIRDKLIHQIPSFAEFNQEQIDALNDCFREVIFEASQIIVKEGDEVDCIYLIAQGLAEVSHEISYGETHLSIPVATLSVGESIGLNETGFYSKSGKRTGTVKALSKMILLKLDIKDLYAVLNRYQLEPFMFQANKQILRLQLIKQSLPFSKLNEERLHWLLNHVEEVTYEAGEIIFNQGDEGDKCYLIYSGEVEILTHTKHGKEKILAHLIPPMLFGEATLITQTRRNATVRAREKTQLLMIDYHYLSELLETDETVATVLMDLMVDRSRPIQNDKVTTHHRETALEQEITILKNTENNHYFKLSKEGFFIWEQLNGKNTLQDITLKLAHQFNVFAPNVVFKIISKLNQYHFVKGLGEHKVITNHDSMLMKIYHQIKNVMEYRLIFKNVDSLLTQIYERYLHYLYTKVGYLILTLLGVFGFIIFVNETPGILAFFNMRHASLFLIFGLLPLSLIAVLLHELGHAFTVKAYGREVHFFGIGWNWLKPIAFTDTTDMWLSPRHPRIVVNLAGIYADLIVAGLAALFILCLPNPYVKSILWLFALYTYIRALSALSPLQDMDGYYVLMDWVEKHHLRKSSIKWLINQFPKCLKKPALFKENWAEVIFWLAAIIFLITITWVTYILQAFIFEIFEIHLTRSYLGLFIPLIVLIASSLRIVNEIRKEE